jgi:hypothetical protein
MPPGLPYPYHNTFGRRWRDLSSRRRSSRVQIVQAVHGRAEPFEIRAIRGEDDVALVPQRGQLPRLLLEPCRPVLIRHRDPDDRAARWNRRGRRGLGIERAILVASSQLPLVGVRQQAGDPQPLQPDALAPAIHLVRLAQQAARAGVLRSPSFVVGHDRHADFFSGVIFDRSTWRCACQRS